MLTMDIAKLIKKKNQSGILINSSNPRKVLQALTELQITTHDADKYTLGATNTTKLRKQFTSELRHPPIETIQLIHMQKH
jgi:hypothetical protein